MEQPAEIKASVTRAATELLNAKDADTALSFYMPNATVVCNGVLYSSFDSFSEDIRNFYNSLQDIKLAIWDEIRINVIDVNTTIFTAKFRWSSIDTKDVSTNLQGVWEAVFVKKDEIWKIVSRHESFANVVTDLAMACDDLIVPSNSSPNP